MRVDRFGLVAALLRLIVALLLAGTTAAFAQAPQKCDVNHDSVIDQTDINLIIAARNSPATGPDDPRDPDNNGVINALDARTCQSRCTRAACSTQNVPPIANAGPDQSVAVGAVVALTGAASTDIDGPSALTYTWTLTAKPAGSPERNATSASPCDSPEVK